MLFKIVGVDMALKYLSSGKGYANVLMSIRELPIKPAQNTNRIFFFGDSTIAALHTEEATPVRLGERLYSRHGKDSIEVIQWAFSGSSMFHFYCLTCKAEDYSPSLIILPINYRTFGSLWQAQTRNNKERKIVSSELIAFAPIWETFDEGVVDINKIEGFAFSERVSVKFKYLEVYYLEGIKLWTQDFFSRVFSNTSPVLERIESENKEAEKAMREIRESVGQVQYSSELFQDLFPEHISSNQIQFQSYAALVNALHRRKIPFLFYVTPLNVQEMREYKAFDPMAFGKSVSLLREVAVENGGSFIDLSTLLEPDDFWRFEHYTPEAAILVAESLVPEVERILGLESSP